MQQLEHRAEHKIEDRLLIVIDPSLLFNDRECAGFGAAASA
jgi:hypothetical protein